MDKIKCPCAIIHWARQIQPCSDVRVLLHVQNDLLTSLCVCIPNGHLVVLSQMSDPSSYLFGLEKMPKRLELSEC